MSPLHPAPGNVMPRRLVIGVCLGIRLLSRRRLHPCRSQVRHVHVVSPAACPC
jgi:hypothetical protein